MKACLKSWTIAATGFMILFIPTAHAQQIQDCPPNQPQLPANASQQEKTAFCAIRHAQYLYAQDCPSSSSCRSEKPGTVQEYRRAAFLFRQYLNLGGYSAQVHAGNSYWLGFLAERSQNYSEAVRNYNRCQQFAQSARPTDTQDLNNCAGGLLRLSCALDSSQAVCSAGNAGAGSRQAVNIAYSDGFGGGRTYEADIDGAGADDDHVSTTRAVVEAPGAAEVTALRNSMGPAQVQQLRAAFAQEKVSVTTAK